MSTKEVLRSIFYSLVMFSMFVWATSFQNPGASGSTFGLFTLSVVYFFISKPRVSAWLTIHLQKRWYVYLFFALALMLTGFNDTFLGGFLTIWAVLLALFGFAMFFDRAGPK